MSTIAHPVLFSAVLLLPPTKLCQVLKSMEALPEDAKLAEIDRQLEEEVDKMEEKVNILD